MPRTGTTPYLGVVLAGELLHAGHVLADQMTNIAFPSWGCDVPSAWQPQSRALDTQRLARVFPVAYRVGVFCGSKRITLLVSYRAGGGLICSWIDEDRWKQRDLVLTDPSH